MCYNVHSESSFENLATKWILERYHHAPNSKYIMVGMQTDKRHNLKYYTSTYRSERRCLNEVPYITREQGEKLAKLMKCEAYLECSAWNLENLEQVIELACRLAMVQLEEAAEEAAKKKKCLLQ